MSVPAAITEEKQRRRNEKQELATAIKEAKEAVLMKSQGQAWVPEATQKFHSSIPRSPIHKSEILPGPRFTVPRPNTTQARLVLDYTGVQKTRTNKTQLFNGQGDTARRINGQVKTMLARTNQNKLTIPTRAADFRSEVRHTLVSPSPLARSFTFPC